MPSPAPTAAPLPRHVRWFAVWRWRLWKLALSAVLMLLTYVAAEEPLAYLIMCRDGRRLGHSRAFSLHCKVYTPMSIAREHCFALQVSSVAQQKWLMKTFGFPPDTCMN
jgi:hypothetical protein